MRVCLCVCPLTCWQAIGWMNGRPLLEVRWHNRNNSADHSDLCLFPHSLRPVLMEARALFWGQQLDLSHCPLCPGTVTLTWCNWCLLLPFFFLLPLRKHTQDKNQSILGTRMTRLYVTICIHFQMSLKGIKESCKPSALCCDTSPW